MGSVYQTEPHRTVMKAFVCVTLLALASAAPTPDVSSHAVVRHGHGPVISHAVHQPHHGPAIVHAPLVHHAPIHHAVHAPVHHAVHHPAVIAHAAPYHAPAPAPYHAPAPAYHKPAPAYHEPAYPDEPNPYTFEYAVADDYSKAAFNAAETSDGAGVVSGAYSVALPDGRTQHVKYTSDHYNGYIAEVTYEGEAHYPEAAPYHPAPAYKPAPAYHA